MLNKEADMTLEDITGGGAAEQRIDRLKDNAASMGEKAKKLKTQANAEAEQLRHRRSTGDQTRTVQSGSVRSIKPHK